MDGDLVLQLKVPLDLIKNQDIYVIGSYTNSVENLKMVGLVVSVNTSTSEFRHIISRVLSIDNEVELIIPINGYTRLRVNHMAIDKHTGRYTVWGKDYTGNEGE